MAILDFGDYRRMMGTVTIIPIQQVTRLNGTSSSPDIPFHTCHIVLVALIIRSNTNSPT